jgi:hypothetical protein
MSTGRHEGLAELPHRHEFGAHVKSSLLIALVLGLSTLLVGGCCITEQCAVRKDAKWMRSTCKPIPTQADEDECIRNVQRTCVKHGLPENCGEPNS